MIKLGILGYGKMGKAIANLAASYDCDVTVIIDPAFEEYESEITLENSQNTDVFIDFSLPEAVLENVRRCIKFHKNVVLGTTGWQTHYNQIKEMVNQSEIGLMYAMNFSVGMNTFFKIVEFSSELFNNLSDYDLYGNELHHRNKVDSPSGTAKVLADILLRNIERKKQLVTDRIDRKIKPEELHFNSIRAGSITGTHTIGFDSQFDTIELMHKAKSSDGFAIGALKAVNWLNGRKGFYSFQDNFFNIIKN